jgi:hypothetical protein
MFCMFTRPGNLIPCSSHVHPNSPGSVRKVLARVPEAAAVGRERKTLRPWAKNLHPSAIVYGKSMINL